MKILMATMSLDIGGAETHIIDLARELSQRGHEITIASRGGVYTSALREFNIRHITVPLHTRSVLSMIRSYNILYREIKKERYDIVHAHARIPAFICGLLEKKLKFRYVTTAHGVYEITPMLKFFSNWGQRQLAVSCDIKKYLIENYNIYSKNITLTINGIDTNVFAPAVNNNQNVREEVCAEFGMSPVCRHRIIYVSRIDKESAHPGFAVLKLLPKLCGLYPDTEFLVVGDGTDFERFIDEADSFNKKNGRKAVFCAGRRTDIPRLLNSADLFVGVSRAAMEAMSCCLPVVLAGSQGFLGFFDEKIKEASIETNFCCRGYKDITPDLIYNSILEAFCLTQEQRRLSGEYNRSIIKQYFSVSRMADDTETVYLDIMRQNIFSRGDIIISGYYGFGNTGDDSLLEVIIDNLKKAIPECSITILSRRPKQTQRIFGVRAINRINPFLIKRELNGAYMLVCGSGNLMQNETSTRSLLYYTTVMNMARRSGLGIMVYASGIGPLYGNFGRALASEALNSADVITLREELSLRELEELGVTKPRIKITADPAIGVSGDDDKWLNYLFSDIGIGAKSKYFAVALREWGEKSASFENDLAEAIIKIKEKYALECVFVPMQYTKDLNICQRVCSRTGGIISKKLCASELIGLCGKMEFVIGMRLHILIYSASAGTPFAGLAYDMKIEALGETFGLSEYNIDVRHFTSEKLIDISGDIIKNRTLISNKISEKTTLLKSMGKIDMEEAAALYGRKQKEKNK